MAPPRHASPSKPPNPISWSRRGLLGLQDLSAEELRLLLTRTRHYATTANDPATQTGELKGRLVATMFFEDSTRTRTSFALAARRLGADTIDFSSGASSVNKGETLVDTALTVEAMGISALIVRARQAGAPHAIAAALKCPVINAGDGKHEHPTQGILDLYTIAEARGRLDSFDFSGLTVAIVGDVASSRVARSAIAGLTTLGAKVVCAGPPALAPASLACLGCTVSNDLDSILPAADAVMMLRIQFERHGEATKGLGAATSPVIPSIREYRELFGMTHDRARRLKPGAIVMHPGPLNRGLEIDGEIADSPRSRILTQVAHGVAARMAVLSLCLS
jgi:aspartate carbamoyltransferase catalytic subunit